MLRKLKKLKRAVAKHTRATEKAIKKLTDYETKLYKELGIEVPATKVKGIEVACDLEYTQE